ncbi:MAG: cell division protein FtsZ [Candidatus Micrarchaeia archaeon]
MGIEDDVFKIRIGVVGVGGGGSNTVQRLSSFGLEAAELIAINTDKKHLSTMNPNIKTLLIGGPLTKGLGAGGYPEIGERAAAYSKKEIREMLHDFNLVFVCAGMGGGTGTGAAPAIAEEAKALGAMVISIVTYPFRMEKVRLKVADEGLRKLKANSDVAIVIDNQALVEAYPNLAMPQAFMLADEITSKAIRGITEALTIPGLMNIDFADLQNIISSSGKSGFISLGYASGPGRVEEVVRNTMESKLLRMNYENAKGVLLHITGGGSLTLGEASEIATKASEKASNAQVTIGARIDPDFGDKVELIAIFIGDDSTPSSSEDNPSIGLDSL